MDPSVPSLDLSKGQKRSQKCSNASGVINKWLGIFTSIISVVDITVCVNWQGKRGHHSNICIKADRVKVKVMVVKNILYLDLTIIMATTTITVLIMIK